MRQRFLNYPAPSARRGGRIRDSTPGKEINTDNTVLLICEPKIFHKQQSPAINLLWSVWSMAQGLCLLPYLKSLCFDTFANQKVNDMHLCRCCLAKSFILICQWYLQQVRVISTFSAVSPDLFSAPLPIKQQTTEVKQSVEPAVQHITKSGFYFGMTLGKRNFLVKYPGWRYTAPHWHQLPEGPSSHSAKSSVLTGASILLCSAKRFMFG